MKRRTYEHHGRSYHAVYATWQRMLARCYGKYHGSYPRYGGRGITVCDRWRNSFEAFLADMGERPDGTELDRFPNNDGNYEPGNCRWATRKQNSLNRRSNVLLTLGGKTQTVTEWGEELGIKRSTISTRLMRGKTVEQALRA